MSILSIGLLAALVGFLGSLLGVGGGAFLVPALVVVFNMEPLQAMPISLMCALATGISGSHILSKDIVAARQIMLFEPAAILGTLLCTPLAYIITAKQLLILFSLFIVLIAFAGYKKSTKTAVLPSPISRTRLDIVGVTIAFFAGSSAGLFGIGGGILLVPLMQLFARVSIKDAMHISLSIMISTSIISLLIHTSMAELPWQTGLIGAIFALCAGVIGRRVRTKISETLLTKIFIAFALAVSCSMLFKVLA